MEKHEANLPENTAELQPAAVAEVWNKLSGGTPIDPIDLENSWNDKNETLTKLWESFSEGIDKYIEEFGVPTELNEGESRAQFTVRLLEHMKGLNRDSRAYRSYCENPVVSMEKGDGAYNCVFGAQVVARICEQAGVDTYIGLPYGHAVTIIEEEAESGNYLYIDVSNTQVARVEPYRGNADFGDAHIGEIAEVLYGREIIPYTFVPVVTVEQSLASTVSNLQYLRDNAAKVNVFAQEMVEFLQLDKTTEYYQAKTHFIPEIADLRNKAVWKDERDQVEEKRQYMSNNYIENVDKITNNEV